MWRLLLIYVLIMVVPRLIRSMLEGRSQRPIARKTPVPPHREEEWIPEVELDPREGEGEVLVARSFRGREMPEASSKEAERAGGGTKARPGPKKKGKKVEDEMPSVAGETQLRPAVGGDSFQSGPWVQGIILSEILSPPRSKRPWWYRK